MAGALYKGITIEFGAKDKNIGQTMKTIDSEARELQKSLNTVNKSLKFNENDPSLLAQRFVLINEQIDTTKERLKQLIEYEKIAREQFENGTISKSQYSSLTREINKTRNELQGLEYDSKEAFDSLKTSILGAKDKLSEFTKAAIAAGAALAANKLKDLGSQAIETASDLREVQNVVDTSFGELAYMMEDLADKAIDVYGISKLTAKETGSTFMSMAKGMDIVPQSAAEMSIALTELSADMASFYNVEQQVAATALNSVFTGETETLKKFGVVMTEANLNAFALSQGIEKTVKQMDQAEKVQLRYNYVMQQTSLAQGDFAKTSGEWANRSRVLKEEITELSSMVGEELINNLGDIQSKADSLFKLVKDAKDSGQLSAVIGDVTAALNKLIDMFVRAVEFIYKYRSEIAAATKGIIAFKAAMKLGNTITSTADSIGKMVTALNTLSAAEKTATTTTNEMNAAASINPWTLFASAVAAVTIALKSYIDGQREALRIGEQIKTAAQEAAEAYEQEAEARRKSIYDINTQYDGYDKLVDKLFEIADSTEQSTDKQCEMKAIIDELNAAIPHLNLSIDGTTGKLSMQREEIENVINKTKEYYAVQGYKNQLTEIATKLAGAESDYNDAIEKRNKAVEENEKALNDLKNAEKAFEDYQKSHDSADIGNNEYNRLRKEVKRYREIQKTTSDIVAEAQDSLNNYKDIYDGLAVSWDKATNYINKYSKSAEEIADEIESGEKATENASKSVEELTESYKSAKDAISSYSSELSSLISLQKSISEGNALSTNELLDLIDKYPELVTHIKSAENGYILEKEAIEELIKVKAKNMELSAQEAAESKRTLLEQQGMSKFEIFSAEMLADTGAIKDIAGIQAGEYTDSLRDYLIAYSQKKGIKSITADIIKNGIKEGSKSSGSTKAETDDISGYFKALEHEHNMGRKSDEQYYNELEALNNKYYKNSKDNLDKYWSYEERIYAYRKKAAEELAKTEEKSNADNVKSLESLKSKIYDVIDARNELNGIKSNKNVQTYDSATGFKYEADQAKLKKAFEDLSKKQDALLIEKLGLGNNNSELISNLKSMIGSLEKAGISGPLPDLKRAYSELKQAGGNVTNNKSYTLNFGDVYTDGSKEDLEDQLARVLEELVRKADRE